MAHAIGSSTGMSVSTIGIVIGLLIVGLALAGRSLWKSKSSMLWAIAAGVSVVSAWAGMQYIHDVGFDELPVVSHTFSAPLGEVIIYGMTASGQTLSFGIGSVVGVLLGAFLGSLIKGHIFRAKTRSLGFLNATEETVHCAVTAIDIVIQIGKHCEVFAMFF